MIEDLYLNNNEALSASLVNIGNLSRIKAVMAKAREGKPVTLGFLGGSITAGAGALEGMHYVRYTTDFWKSAFPDSEITCVNAGLGATGSILGVFRMDKDVLSAKPDVLVVDHSVNDNGDEPLVPGGTKHTYEAVIRRAILAGAAVVPICFCNEGGISKQETDLEIARRYDIPFVSMVDGIYKPLIASGKREWREYSPDSVHPNSEGHRMAAELLINYFKLAMSDKGNDVKYTIPKQLFGALYMNTEMLDGRMAMPVSYGAFEVKDLDFYQFRGGWSTEEAGEPIVFELHGCRCVHIAHLREPSELAGKATVSVNGEELEADAFFENGWGKYAKTLCVFSSDKATDVTLSVRPTEKGKRFALLRVMVAR